MAIKLIGVSGDRLPFPGDEDNTQDLLFNGHNALFAGDPEQVYSYFQCLRERRRLLQRLEKPLRRPAFSDASARRL